MSRWPNFVVYAVMRWEGRRKYQPYTFCPRKKDALAYVKRINQWHADSDKQHLAYVQAYGPYS
jgi:hypothetical protein